IGYSDDYCPLYFLVDPKANNALDWDAAQAAQIKTAEDCFRAAAARGVDLSGYNTIENARDVEALRRALGYKQWNVWGISYGSYLGQAYLKQDPAGVRAAVIDAIVPFEQSVQFLRIALHYDRDLKLLGEACKADALCAKHFVDSQKRLEAAIEAVRKEPIVIENAIDKESFPNGKAVLFHNLIAGAPFQALYEQKNYGALPAFIDALANMVEKKDYAGLRAATAQAPVETGGRGFISQGMYNAIGCNDGWVASLEAAVKQDVAEFPALGALQGDPKYAAEQAAMCVRNGLAPRDPAWYQPLVTAIPMIVANGQMDPITPPPLAKAIMPGLKNGTYVEFPYAGHGPTRSVKCAGEFLTKFFDNPKAPVDTSCAKSMKAPTFIGPLYETRGPLRVAEAMAADPAKAALYMAWGGAAAFILVIGMIVYTIAPVARFVNSDQAMTTSGARPLAWVVSMLGGVSILGRGLARAKSSAAKVAMLLVG
ncbi:MAG: alpha/beta hydrolase, partial [Parvularculaceae bacterium]|nr:alpha/beta hydrolase [Parvularculaceae bacterium]